MAEPTPQDAEKARALEVFVDAVGAFATQDASWLLDSWFDALVSDPGKQWADQLRKLAQEISAAGDAEPDWASFLATLTSLGAEPSASRTDRESHRKIGG